MALSDGCREAIFLQNLLQDLFGKYFPVEVYNDSQSAQKMATYHMSHSRTKHIDIKHHYVRDVVEKKRLNLKYLPTENMCADVLTKSLNGPKHYKCIKELNLS